MYMFSNKYGNPSSVEKETLKEGPPRWAAGRNRSPAAISSAPEDPQVVLNVSLWSATKTIGTNDEICVPVSLCLEEFGAFASVVFVRFVSGGSSGD
jgi:hypothetical protein